MRAEQARGDRDRLRMVAGRVGEHAAPPQVLRQRRDLVVRAAKLERAAALEALGLQMHRRADEPVERARREDGRAVGDALEAPGGRLHVVEVDHRHGFVCARSKPKPQSFPSTM